MPAEFDRYAAQGYSKTLLDPIRGRFAGAEFYFRRKLILLKEFCQQRGIQMEGSDWLDVGCGDGGLLKMGQPYFRTAAGCDVSEGMLGECAGLNVKQQDSPRRVPFGDQGFDIVTMVCVYHHVDIADRPALTADVSRVLKPGGLLCVIEHNPFNPVTQFVVWRHPVDAHARLLTAGKMRRLAQATQLEILATRYFLFFPERLYSALAATEAKLSSVPLGGQYAVFCRKR
jgi:ubiquinone/menaquinone biosynthesis C-methylase UbiE